MASITKRGNGYRITVSNGRNANGKQILETATFIPDPSKTEKQNQKALQLFALNFENKVKSGKYLEGEKMTFKDFVEIWKRDYAEINLERSTLERHYDILDNHILPEIGNLKLARIQPAHLNRLYSDMLQERKDGKPGGYASATITKTHAVISGILKKAVQWNILLDNPADRVTPPKSNGPEKEIQFFSVEETGIFLETLEAQIKKGIVKEQFRLLFNLAITCGLRRGEIIALEWSDFDFKNNTISIAKAIGTDHGRAYDKGPKSRRGYRSISVPGSVMAMAKEYQKHQLQYRLSIGSYWQGSNYIFIQDNGCRMDPSTPNRVFKKIIKRYNRDAPEALQLPDNITLHGLRHTSATLLIAQKVDPRTVSGRLGHAQTSTTLNIYAHQLQEIDRQAADIMEHLINVNQTLTKQENGVS